MRAFLATSKGTASFAGTEGAKPSWREWRDGGRRLGFDRVESGQRERQAGDLLAIALTGATTKQFMKPA
jgi:hypothetical protein